MANSSYSAFNALVDIIASPAKAFDGIKSHTSWFWLPLLISIALASGLLVYYYSWVDFEWLIEYTLDTQIAPEDRAASEDAVRSFMNPTSSMVTSVLAIVIITFLIYLLQALYFHLANKMTAGADLSYGQWFNFSAWANFVNIFGAIAGFVVIFMASSNQLPSQDLQVFSMNNLFIHAEPREPWFTWGSFVHLLILWVIALCAIGFARWTGATIAKSAIISALPWVLIYGIWAALI